MEKSAKKAIPSKSRTGKNVKCQNPNANEGLQPFDIWILTFSIYLGWESSQPWETSQAEQSQPHDAEALFFRLL
jgi:hypothetical protein